MGLTSKGVTLTSALAGVALFSQSPEIAQQYRQRLGGALEEMRTVVEEFDKDAASSNLTRYEALRTMQRSSDQLVQDRGESMAEVVDRFFALEQQKSQMENAHPFTRPLFVLQYPDQKLLEGVWEDFEPAVPLTSAGALYGGLGAILFGFLARMGIAPFRGRRQRKSDKVLERAIQKGQDVKADVSVDVEHPAQKSPENQPPKPIWRQGEIVEPGQKGYSDLADDDVMEPRDSRPYPKADG